MAGSSVNVINTSVDQTVRIFDEFYNFSVDVPVNTYDVVNSYFISIFSTADAAKSFTISLFRVAQESGTDVMTLLEQMQGQNDIQLSITMAYYLNSLRSSATLLGVNVTVTPNYYTARNVLP